MSHCCIVYNRNSTKSIKLSFYHLPTAILAFAEEVVNNKDTKLNTPVNEYPTVCSAYFEKGKKESKSDMPKIIVWTKRWSADLCSNLLCICISHG